MLGILMASDFHPFAAKFLGTITKESRSGPTGRSLDMTEVKVPKILEHQTKGFARNRPTDYFWLHIRASLLICLRNKESSNGIQTLSGSFSIVLLLLTSHSEPLKRGL
jgi:hypothetical protein